MQILDHPTIVRAVAGEVITAQELREVFVDFWQKNGTFEICAKCPVPPYSTAPEYKPREKGCCCACTDWKKGEGCTRRNLRCLAHTCGHLEKLLQKADLWEEFKDFRDMLWWGPMSHKEPYFNHARLPDDAPVFIIEHTYDPGRVIFDSTQPGICRNGATSW
jgi:hypothetical protein